MTSYKKPNVAIDVVLLTVADNQLKVALHRRRADPFKGRLALPGAYVFTDQDRSTTDTAYRALREKTGLTPRYLEQLCTMSGPDRDPRGWSVAVSHVALIPLEELQAVGDEVFQFYSVDALPELAFDHAEQIRIAVDRVRNKSSYSTLPCWLLPETFTLTELQHVYEHVSGETIDRGTFRSRLGIKALEIEPGQCVDGAQILEATNQFRGGARRPARLFRVNHLSLFKRPIW